MKPGTKLGFWLEKQYFDCIDDRGNCIIIYRAEFSFLFIKIHYSALIFSDSNNITTCKSSLRKSKNPEPGENLFYISNPLEISGSWKKIESALPLYRLRGSRNRELTWNCHHPKTNTEISYKGDTFRGYGYAETLLLTIMPHNLPLDEIRWGRFLSDDYSIVWIIWKGTHPLNKLYCNGQEFNDVQHGEECLTFDNARYQLTFSENAIIRKGKLSSLFSDIPYLKILSVKSVLNSTENKYKAKTILRHDQKLSASGWSLYEIVTWKN
jgi:hypothetical protein